MATPSPYRSSLLSLYKNIMGLHRRKLPSELRDVGDDYVRAEFKAIKKAKMNVHVEEFITKWQEYANVIKNQNDRFGVRMKTSMVEKLDVEQQEQLRKLKTAAVAAAARSEGVDLDAIDLFGGQDLNSIPVDENPRNRRL